MREERGIPITDCAWCDQSDQDESQYKPGKKQRVANPDSHACHNAGNFVHTASALIPSWCKKAHFRDLLGSVSPLQFWGDQA